jgi:hypothetical protein
MSERQRPLAYGYAEIAEALGVTPVYVRTNLRSRGLGELVTQRLSSGPVWLPEDIEPWIDAVRRVQAEGAPTFRAVCLAEAALGAPPWRDRTVRPFYDVRRLADAAGVQPITVRVWQQRGHLPPTVEGWRDRHPRRPLWWARDVVPWLAQRSTPQVSRRAASRELGVSPERLTAALDVGVIPDLARSTVDRLLADPEALSGLRRVPTPHEVARRAEAEQRGGELDRIASLIATRRGSR